MKKNLVAVAALAVAGGAFAQSTVNLTGKLAFGYESVKAQSGAKANGLRVTDGDFVLTAVEDLGGGMKAQASMAVQSRGRTTAVAGRDATVSLMGGFGVVTIGAVEAGNGILGLAGAGAPVLGLDNGSTMLAGGTNVDLLSYTTPNMGGFTAKLQMFDMSSTAAGSGTGGMESTAVAQDGFVIGADYANGPVKFSADYTSYGANTAAAPVGDNRIRISGNYNLGVATVGLGFQKTALVGGTDVKDLALGVSAPFGPVTVGLVYGTHKVGAGAANKGLDLGVQYDLSKRTNLRVVYQSIDVKNPASAPAAVIATSTDTAVRIRVLHSF